MALAAASTSRRLAAAIVGSAGLMSTATRAVFGTSVRRSSSRFADSSAAKKLMPVALPPGRDRLATRPSRTGSSGTMKTTGIVVVARAAAREAGALTTAIALTWRRTSSSASTLSRAGSFSAQRYSIATVSPSM